MSSLVEVEVIAECIPLPPLFFEVGVNLYSQPPTALLLSYDFFGIIPKV